MATESEEGQEITANDAEAVCLSQMLDLSAYLLPLLQVDEVQQEQWEGLQEMGRSCQGSRLWQELLLVLLLEDIGEPAVVSLKALVW